MKKATRPVEQSRPRKADHITDLLSKGRVYYHPEGGMIEIHKGVRDITVTSEDGDSASLSIGPLGCIAPGKALQAEGLAWLAG